MAIKILIDSASDITLEEAKKLGIEFLPLAINFEGHEYKDGVDITADDFYKKLEVCENLPKTSQAGPAKYASEYKRLTENGDELIVITLSSKLSGTYMSALVASYDYEEKVYVVDSLNATTGERLLCLYALDLIKQGFNVKEIVDKLNTAKKKINVVAIINTLEYLKKGGRISQAVAFAGELLSIKPVISVVDGEIKVIGKAIGSKKANNLLNKLITNKEIDYSMPYGLIWSGYEKDVINKYLIDSKKVWKDNLENIPLYQLGCTIGVHIGPGGVGCAFFEK